MSYVLLASVFVIATCGLVYELIAGALASYLLGDSITQFSTVIGVYLFSMGIGSYLSRFINRNLIAVFVKVELLIGLIGGFSAAILFVSFEYITSFRVLLYGIVGLTGVLVGFEIPILMRIMQNRFEFKDLVSKVFTFDYIGALLASLLFPLILVPHLGLIKSAFLFGIFNVVVAIWTLFLFAEELRWVSLMKGVGFAVLAALVFGFVYSDRIQSFSEASNYHDKIIYSKTTRYQRLVLTSAGGDLRLFLNGNLQFSSRDEYRYHEGLIHVGLASIKQPRTALVLGGGDGLAVREILKYPSIEEIILVDLDREMTDLFTKHPLLQELNQGSLSSPKVKVINDDAFLWLKKNPDMKFDFVAIDFPDPSNFSVGKLYTTAFYKLLKPVLAQRGVGVIQSTSPYVAKKSFWCVNNTLQYAGFKTAPYHVYVPAFGDWGYILIHQSDFKIPDQYPQGLRFINNSVAKSLFVFPADQIFASRDVNRLNNQILVRHFEDEWAGYVQ